jgi:WD40 repeat protein
VATGEELHCFKGQPEERHFFVAFSPDGRLGLSSGDFRLRAWNLKTRKCVWSARHKSGLTQVAFTRDGRSVLTAAFTPAPAEGEAARGKAPGTGTLTVIRRDARTGKEQRRYAGPVKCLASDGWFISVVAFTPDGDGVLTGDVKGDVRLWTLPK